MWNKLKAIFKNETVNTEYCLNAEFSQQVEHAIALFKNHENLNTDEEVIQLFINNGIRPKEAKEILVFLPIAFARQLLPTVKWIDTYLELFSEEKKTVRKYNETESYQIIWRITTQYFKNNPQPEILIKIGGRSAEFRVINKLLLNNPNIKLEDIKLTPTVINRSV